MDFSNSWPNSLHLCFYTLLFILSSLFLPSASVATHVSCLSDQSSSLLQVKRGFFHSGLTSWQPGTDCCHGWEGVSCDKATGHVTALDISDSNIRGNLSAAIFNLTSLQHLNLANNYFPQNQIPAHGFEKLTMLTYLNLSNTDFFGQIPIAIANLTNLISLDLSCDYEIFDCDLKLHEPNLRILVSQLSNLRELYLDGADISENGTEWCRALSESVPHLDVLSMVHCNLSGPIESSLSQLGSLTVIRLGHNSLKTQIPDYLSEFSLRDLQLQNCLLEGLFPNEIFHIPTLTKLDLSRNDLIGRLPNFPIVSSLESLVLDLNNFFGSIPDSIGNLRNLSELSLHACNFSGQIPSSIEKLRKLAILDVSYNSHSGSIPESLFSLPSLETLDLSFNKLSGQLRLKDSSVSFSPLIELDLSENQLNGPIPWQIFKFSNLENIYLSGNQFSGPIPNSIVWLSSLRVLHLSSNNFNGTFDLNLLQHLRNLTTLFLSDNQLFVEDVSDEQLPLAFPQIFSFGLASCNLTQMPRLLRYVGDMYHVDLSKNQLHGVIPRWIWKKFMYSNAQLNLSQNMLTSVEDVPPCSSHPCVLFASIDFSFNKLKGAVPLVAAYILDYSKNEFSEIPSNYTLYLEQTAYLSLSGNMLTGEIPSSICETSLNVLDLSNNNLSGSIPSCIIGSPDMQILSLRGNNFSGILSRHISRSCALVILDLNSNNIEGNLPRSLTRCKELALLDTGNNRIGGTFPFSHGNLPNVQVIILRSNRFYGTLDLPSNFGKMNSLFPLLRIIDLASNNFNGSLPPHWLSNFKSMQNLSSYESLGRNLGGGYIEIGYNYIRGWAALKKYGISVTITDKGAQMTLEKDLPNLMVSIDLSRNRFTGDIPEAIGELKAIKALNMSNNAFTGFIPNGLGHLTQIESLDLSWNQLSGEIPQELISLNFLSILNLSFNHLVGRIPQSGQFLSFDNSSFEGNPGLCGFPLSKLCNVTSPGNNSTSPPGKSATKMTAIVLLCLFIGLGFGTGFGIAIISPVIKRARNAHATR